MNRTFLYETHLSLNAKLVNFSGWEMPINYGSQIREHNEVRNNIGIFDVSHMSIFDITGKDSKDFLSYILANNVTKIVEGQALYSLILNHAGGILDDLIVYKLHDRYRVVSNCATHDQNANWFQSNILSFDAEITYRENLGILAVQGPNSSKVLSSSVSKQLMELTNFTFIELEGLFVAKTGYTGEEGFEIIGSFDLLSELWDQLISAGISPIGLAARDTLRLEAGLNLSGTDMNRTNNPYESNLGWTVDVQDPDRNFVGKEALYTLKKNNSLKLVGCILESKGILRSGQKIIQGNREGIVLSGTFSPTLQKSIALIRVPNDFEGTAQVEIRNKLFDIKLVCPPFVRKGKIVV